MTEMSFEALPLAAPIQRALSEKGYTTPSPIQAAAIPVLLENHDLLACAQTGTGKTAAFALPILQRLFTERRKTKQYRVRVLVLTPTRELAVQIADSFRTYGKYMRLSLGLVHGGVSQRPQERALQGGLDVLVATPGRLIDLFEQGCMDLSEVDTFVLDEADRMLDMGFIHDIRRIAKELPEDRQTLLFSATMADEIARLASQLLKEPQEIRIAPAATTAEKIEQKLYFVLHEDKRALLTQLLEDHGDGNPAELRLIFTKTKHGANRLATQLNKEGIPAEAIHGNKTQAARLKALERFRKGKTSVLVATDVAARGIDVKDITLVVNFDMPMEPDSYVHRIGRTARAGASGLAVSFCSAEELKLLTAVQRLIRQDIPVEADHNFHAESIATRYRNFASRGKGGRGAGRSSFGGGRSGGQSRDNRSTGADRSAAGSRRFSDSQAGESRPERSERAERPERSERFGRPQRAERSEQPDRSERRERFDRPERAERAGRFNGAERGNRFGGQRDSAAAGSAERGATRGKRFEQGTGGQTPRSGGNRTSGNARSEARSGGNARAEREQRLFGGRAGKGGKRPAQGGGRQGSFGERHVATAESRPAKKGIGRFFRGLGR